MTAAAAGTGTGTTATTDPPAGGATPPAPAPSTTSTDPEGLGDAGLKALRAERARAEKAERDLAAATAERDELKSKTQTESEKAIEAARKEGEATANLAANRRIAKSEVRGAAAGKVADVEDAVTLLGDLDRFIVKGEVDGKAIASAIDELVKAKPYLAPAGKARPIPGGGATQSTGLSLNDDIRRRAGRG